MWSKSPATSWLDGPWEKDAAASFWPRRTACSSHDRCCYRNRSVNINTDANHSWRRRELCFSRSEVNIPPCLGVLKKHQLAYCLGGANPCSISFFFNPFFLDKFWKEWVTYLRSVTSVFLPLSPVEYVGTLLYGVKSWRKFLSIERLFVNLKPGLLDY